MAASQASAEQRVCTMPGVFESSDRCCCLAAAGSHDSNFSADGQCPQLFLVSVAKITTEFKNYHLVPATVHLVQAMASPEDQFALRASTELTRSCWHFLPALS